MTEYNSNITKGGALLSDSRRLVEVWDSNLPPDKNLTVIRDQNLLGKPSRARAADVLAVLRARFVDPGPQVIATLRALMGNPPAFREACYYETARNDRLFADFAEGPLFDRYSEGRLTITLEETQGWLRRRQGQGAIPRWSESLTARVAHGFLSTLRDFGILEGARNKRYSSPTLSPPGFAYVAFRLREQGSSGHSLINSRVWRRWLLTDDEVADLIGQADRLGVLRYSKAGSSVRIDWLVDRLEEVALAAA
jgi:hypothetical protein